MESFCFETFAVLFIILCFVANWRLAAAVHFPFLENVFASCYKFNRI